MSEIKAQFAGFFNAYFWAVNKDGEDVRLKLRLNPNGISSYYESVITLKDGTLRPITCVTCGTPYLVDLPIDEFDKFMKTIDRGLSFEDNDLK